MIAMSTVAHSHPYIVGVDTHARNHVYSILAAHTGAPLETRSFPSSAAGRSRALSWVSRHTEADADTLWVIEGAASYGAILAGIVAAHGYPVAEAPRMDARNRRGVGKSDVMDAFRIAAAARPLRVEELRRPRLREGIRQGVQILVTARESMTKDRTRSVNALNALVRSNDLGLDAREIGAERIGWGRSSTELRVPMDVFIQQVAELSGPAGVAGLWAECPEPHEVTSLHFDPVLIEPVHRLAFENIEPVFHDVSLREWNDPPGFEGHDSNVHVVPDVIRVNKTGRSPVAVGARHRGRIHVLFVGDERPWNLDAVDILVGLAKPVEAGRIACVVPHGPRAVWREEGVSAGEEFVVIPVNGEAERAFHEE